MNTGKRVLRGLIALALTMFVLVPTIASAVPVNASYSLTVPNDALSELSPPFATVAITADTDTGILTFVLTAVQPKSSTSPALIAGFAFNSLVAADDIDITKTTAFNSAGDALTWTPLTTNAHMDGLGDYDFGVIATPLDPTQRTTQATITIYMKEDHKSEATIANFAFGTSDSKGYSFATHYYSANGGTTGYIAGYTPSSDPSPGPALVPEPSSLALAGISALVFLAYGLHKRRGV